MMEQLWISVQRLLGKSSGEHHHILDYNPKELDSYEFFRDFFFKDQAEDLIQLLQQKRIPYKLEERKTILDPVITGDTLSPKFILKLRPADFSAVRSLIIRHTEEDNVFVENHYLQSFSTQELLELLRQEDEWSIEDVVVAQAILKNRGEEVPEARFTQQRQARLDQLKAGKQGQVLWMMLYLGFLFVSMWINPFFLLVPIGMGWYYWTDKTLDSHGRKFATFNKKTRIFGQVLFCLGCLVAILFLVNHSSLIFGNLF